MTRDLSQVSNPAPNTIFVFELTSRQISLPLELHCTKEWGEIDRSRHGILHALEATSLYLLLFLHEYHDA